MTLNATIRDDQDRRYAIASVIGHLAVAIDAVADRGDIPEIGLQKLREVKSLFAALGDLMTADNLLSKAPQMHGRKKKQRSGPDEGALYRVTALDYGQAQIAAVGEPAVSIRPAIGPRKSDDGR